MTQNKPDITDNLLIKLAGEGAFERGEDYFNRGGRRRAEDIPAIKSRRR